MRYLLMALLMSLTQAASAESGGGVEFNRPVQAVDFNHDIDVSEFERFSIQVDYEDGAPATPSVLDGNFSSTTLTVVSYTGLAGTRSSATLTLLTGKNRAVDLDGLIIRINGRRYTEGVDWTRSPDSSTITMKSLQTAIDAYEEYQAIVSSNIVTVIANSSGVYSNDWTITSSSVGAIVTGAATFDNGQEPGYVTINGTTLTEGTDFDAITSTCTTSDKIAVAINANATLTALVSVSSSPTGCTLLVQSKLTGINAYPVSVSGTALTTRYSSFFGGAASEVSLANDTLTETAHGLSLGLAVLYSTSASKVITGLNSQTTYYIIPVDANSFQVAASSTLAVAGTEIDLTAVSGGGTYVFTPLAFASGPLDGFKYQGSNDGTTFYDLSVTSGPYQSDSGLLSSFTDYAYKYLRFKYTQPNRGGINLNAILNYRKN